MGLFKTLFYIFSKRGGKLEVTNTSFGVVPVNFSDPSHADLLSQHSNFRLDLSRREQGLINAQGQKQLILSYKPDFTFPVMVVGFRHYGSKMNKETREVERYCKDMVVAHYAVTVGGTYYSVIDYFYVEDSGLLNPSIDVLCTFDGSLNNLSLCFKELFTRYASGTFIGNGFVRDEERFKRVEPKRELEICNRFFGVVPVRFNDPSHEEILTQHSKYEIILSEEERKLIGAEEQFVLVLSYKPDINFRIGVCGFRHYGSIKNRQTGEFERYCKRMVVAHYAVTVEDTHYSVIDYYYVDDSGLLSPSIDMFFEFDGTLDELNKCFDDLIGHYTRGTLENNGFVRIEGGLLDLLKRRLQRTRQKPN